MYAFKSEAVAIFNVPAISISPVRSRLSKSAVVGVNVSLASILPSISPTNLVVAVIVGASILVPASTVVNLAGAAEANPAVFTASIPISLLVIRLKCIVEPASFVTTPCIPAFASIRALAVNSPLVVNVPVLTSVACKSPLK